MGKHCSFFTLHTPETNPTQEEGNSFKLSSIMIFFIAENDPLKNMEHGLEIADVGCSVCIKNCDVRKSETYIAMNLTMQTTLSVSIKPLN
jgi:hypothetical protein